jgi:hypothetical protein
MICTNCGIIVADARPHWQEQPPRETLTCPMAVNPRNRGPGADQFRALEILAGSPQGCTEETLRAHWFTVRLLAG